MNIKMIKERLHEYIDHADDKYLEAIFLLLGLETDADARRQALIQEERTKYLNGEGKSFSPEEVKAMAVLELNKRIDQSEEDFKNGRFKESAALLTKYKE